MSSRSRSPAISTAMVLAQWPVAEYRASFETSYVVFRTPHNCLHNACFLMDCRNSVITWKHDRLQYRKGIRCSLITSNIRHQSVQIGINMASPTNPSTTSTTMEPLASYRDFIRDGIEEVEFNHFVLNSDICPMCHKAAVDSSEDDVSVVKTRSCGHVFHRVCLLGYFAFMELDVTRTEAYGNCPSCRVSLFKSQPSEQRLLSARDRLQIARDNSGRVEREVLALMHDLYLLQGDGRNRDSWARDALGRLDAMHTEFRIPLGDYIFCDAATPFLQQGSEQVPVVDQNSGDIVALPEQQDSEQAPAAEQNSVDNRDLPEQEGSEQNSGHSLPSELTSAIGVVGEQIAAARPDPHPQNEQVLAAPSSRDPPRTASQLREQVQELELLLAALETSLDDLRNGF
ncbi:hypothetical protein BS50DRAFT_25871 [Corynespora cassiicola Philippines]|uniref:RING-type domain-containing protein n=1 Tax=Corynespora cassiicola Philippines TaxID=1448308 RepID=A0A2T2PB31_CORCC|nr:hypothetical protein BS50DRAFT_25871 [Corynespora cassiicola Philippines]